MGVRIVSSHDGRGGRRAAGGVGGGTGHGRHVKVVREIFVDVFTFGQQRKNRAFVTLVTKKKKNQKKTKKRGRHDATYQDTEVHLGGDGACPEADQEKKEREHHETESHLFYLAWCVTPGDARFPLLSNEACSYLYYDSMIFMSHVDMLRVVRVPSNL